MNKQNFFVSVLFLGSLLAVMIYSGSFELKDLTSYAVVQENEIPNDYGDPIEIYFCPLDNCTYNFTYNINNAKNSIHCALFDLDNEIIINAFVKKSKEIDVKLFMDDGYALDLDFVKKDNSNQLSHNKFCVFDGESVWTGSYNPTERGTYMNNNNVLIIDSKSLAVNYENEFQELWKGTYGRGLGVDYPVLFYNDKKIENYFCPDDSCEERFVNILENAEESIYFMTFSFTLDSIGNVLIDKYNSGLDVKGVFERTQNNKYNEFVRLNDSKVPVKWDLNKYKMHHKVFIIDEKIVITGSTNPTGNGCSNNDENILIIHDENIAFKYLEEFRNVWGEPI